MINLMHIPARPLSEFVRFLWLYHGYTQPHLKERALPTGEMQLIINLRENRSCIYDREDTDLCQTLSGSLISGAHSEYLVIDTAMQSFVIGACFKPNGAFPFLRMPAGELSNATVSLDGLWGAAAADLRDRLLEAPTHQARFEILEQALLAELSRGVHRHPAVQFALCRFMAAPHMTTIASVTDQIALSPKRFIQVFRDETGFAPKVFCRIRRFQQALERMESRKSLEWADVALDCGYYDQAHFNHDFRAFSGINPSAYLTRQTPHRNHVPLVV